MTYNKREKSKYNTFDYQSVGEPMSIDELMKLDIPDDIFLVKDLIPERGITAISGHPGCGKTWFYLFLAKSVATGKSFLGEFDVLQRNVLIVDEENGFKELRRRSQKMIEIDQDLPIYFFSNKGFKVDDDGYVDCLVDVVEKNKIGLIIFDPLIALSDANENDSRDIQKIMYGFTKIIKSGATVIFVHHHRKDGAISNGGSQSLRGSSAISGRVDSHISIKKENSSDGQSELIVSQEKMRRGQAIEPFKLSLRDNEEDNKKMSLIFLGKKEAEKLKKEKAKDLIHEILEKAPKGVLGEDLTNIIKKEADISHRNVYSALKEMEDEEWTIRSVRDGKKKLYLLNNIEELKEEQDKTQS